jgi:transposase
MILAFPTHGGRGTQPGLCRGSERAVVPYRRYSLQFKDEACRMAAGQDENPARAAKNLGVPEMTLRSWMKQRKLLPESKKPVALLPADSNDINVVRMQLREAERRIRQLEIEKDILKKATAFFAKEQP